MEEQIYFRTKFSFVDFLWAALKHIFFAILSGASAIIIGILFIKLADAVGFDTSSVIKVFVFAISTLLGVCFPIAGVIIIIFRPILYCIRHLFAYAEIVDGAVIIKPCYKPTKKQTLGFDDIINVKSSEGHGVWIDVVGAEDTTKTFVVFTVSNGGEFCDYFWRVSGKTPPAPPTEEESNDTDDKTEGE